jgi:hypothetical protein
LVIAPRHLVASWTGVAGKDFDRACKVTGAGAISIGKGKGLVISEPGSLRFWPTKTGGLVVIAFGSDSAAGCIAAALAIPDKEWKREKATLVVDKGATEYLMFDSAAPGTTLRANGLIGKQDFESPTAAFELAAGRYAIDACWSWETQVKVGKRVEDTMIGALRFRRSS